MRANRFNKNGKQLRARRSKVKRDNARRHRRMLACVHDPDWIKGSWDVFRDPELAIPGWVCGDLPHWEDLEEGMQDAWRRFMCTPLGTDLPKWFDDLRFGGDKHL